jgi:beta-lactam-binding protein with PASTA domain
VRVQDYTGSKLSDVIRDLSQYTYLKVSTREETSDTAAPGTVISQELLKPGDMFNPNTASEIRLVYVRYPTIIIPPEINGMLVEEASQLLESMGVEVFSSNLDTTGLSEEEIANLNTGVVIRSDPEAGSEYTQKDDTYVVLYYY